MYVRVRAVLVPDICDPAGLAPRTYIDRRVAVTSTAHIHALDLFVSELASK